MRTRDATLIALVFGLVLACTRVHPAPPHPESVGVIECHYTMPDSSPVYLEVDVDLPQKPVKLGMSPYPPEMKARHIEGWVILRFVVDASGMVIGPSIAVDTATNPAFIPPAKEAVTGTQFAPATHSGRPVAVCVQQTINFSIS